MLQGDVNNLPLSALLQGLDANRNSGILSIEGNGLILRLGIDQRGIELLTDPEGGPGPLADALSALDVLQHKELTKLVAGQGKIPVGDALLRFRLLDPSMVTGPIRMLFQEQLLELFRWDGASYRFEVCPWKNQRLFTGEAVAPSLRFPIPSLLLEVACREDEELRLDEAGVHPDEIYLTTSDSVAIEEALESLLPCDALRKKFVKELQRSSPLRDGMQATGTPRYLSLMATRTLLEENHIVPMPPLEKAALADRLLQQRLPGRALQVLRSAVRLGDADRGCLEKLNPLLIQEKAPVEERASVLAALAEAREKDGDQLGNRKALRQRSDLLPEDLDAMIDLLDAMPRGKSRRETEKILNRLHDGVGSPAEAVQIAEVIESRRGKDPAKTPKWVEKCARLRIFGEDPEGASQLLHSLLRDGVRRNRELKSLQSILALLETIDGKQHRRWKSRIHRRGSVASRNGGIVLAVGIALVVYFILQQAPLPPEQLLAETSDSSVAQRLLERSDVETEPKPVTVVTEGQIERTFSRALRLRTEGNYSEALKALETLQNSNASTTTRRSIEKVRNEMLLYLAEADQLHQRSILLEQEGQSQQALQLQLELVRKYPYSLVVTDLMLEIPVSIAPAGTRILLDGEVLEVTAGSGGPFIRLPAARSVLLTADAPGHESQLIWHEPGKHPVLEIMPSRKPYHAFQAGHLNSLVLHADENSFLLLENGSLLKRRSFDEEGLQWQLSLKGSGDLLGGILETDDGLFIATSAGHLMQFDGQTGEILSEVKIPTRGSIVRDAPIVSGDQLLVITSQGWIHGFARESLTPRWNRQFEGSLRRGALLQATDQLLVSTSSSVVSIDPSTGATRWNHPVNGRLHRCVSDGAFIYLVSDDGMEKIDSSSGETVWMSVLDGSTTHSLLTSEGVVLHLDEEGVISCFDSDQGDLNWTRSISASPLSCVVETGRFIVSDGLSRIQAYRLPGGEPLWEHRGASPVISTFLHGESLFSIDQQGSVKTFHIGDKSDDLPDFEEPS